jgi:hypothetical protein
LMGMRLDYWVARAEGYPAESIYFNERGQCCLKAFAGHDAAEPFRPSDFWLDGGPIIERIKILPNYYEEMGQFGQPLPPVWKARVFDHGAWPIVRWAGPTLLIAAMRAYVASVFGEEVPNEV